MSASRKGLKRHGLRSYIVVGPAISIIIERERPWRWLLRPAHVAPPFFSEQHRRLKDARTAAEQWTGNKSFT